jgi:hypothetical protein
MTVQYGRAPVPERENGVECWANLGQSVPERQISEVI